MQEELDIGIEFRNFREALRTAKEAKANELISPAYQNEEVGESVTGFNEMSQLLTDQQVYEVFSAINHSKSGFVTRQQINFFLDFFKLQASSTDLDEMLALCQPKEKDVIDFQSFKEMIRSVFPIAHSTITTPEMQAVSQAVKNLKSCPVLTGSLVNDRQFHKQLLTTVNQIQQEERKKQMMLQTLYPIIQSQKKIKEANIQKIHNPRTQESGHNYSQRLLRRLKDIYQQFYQKNLDLFKLKSFIAKLGKYEKDLLLKQEAIKVLAQLLGLKMKGAFDYIEQLLNAMGCKVISLRDISIFLIAVSGMQSLVKLETALSLFKDRIQFEEVLTVTALLSFQQRSPLQAKLRQIFNKENAGPTPAKQVVIQIFKKHQDCLFL